MGLYAIPSDYIIYDSINEKRSKRSFLAFYALLCLASYRKKVRERNTSSSKRRGYYYYPFMGSFTPTSFTHEGGPRIDKEPGKPDILPELSGLAPKKGKIYLP